MRTTEQNINLQIFREHKYSISKLTTEIKTILISYANTQDLSYLDLVNIKEKKITEFYDLMEDLI